MTELNREERSKICDAFRTGHWTSVVHAVEELINERNDRIHAEAVARRQHEFELSRQKAGHVEGYTPECGKAEQHMMHLMSYTDIWCFGYCDCKYQAKYPHPTGEHK